MHPFRFPRKIGARNVRLPGRPRANPAPGPAGPPGLSAEDLLFRSAVQEFFGHNLREAHYRLGRDQLVRFLDFRDQWTDLVNWDVQAKLDSYLRCDQPMRRRKFEEFCSLSRAWELCLRYQPKKRPPPRPAARPDQAAAVPHEDAAADLRPPGVRLALAKLGLSADADPSQVRARFKALAKDHHPDRQQGAVAVMQELSAAYSTVMAYFRSL